jgi:3-oxoadipate CoA-transferase alpha subunit
VTRVKNKIYPSVDAAVADVSDGASLMFGGFGGAGFPNELIRAVGRKGARNLFAISNNCGTGEGELGVLFKNKQIRRVIAAFPGPQSTYFQQQVEAGEVEYELVPQGILCERMRTEVAQGKEERSINGRRCILESALGADFALIRALKADPLGNLIYRKAARNFNPVMATAAKVTIVEVNEIVPVGALDPETIVTPSVFVHRIVEVGGAHDA